MIDDGRVNHTAADTDTFTEATDTDTDTYGVPSVGYKYIPME